MAETQAQAQSTEPTRVETDAALAQTEQHTQSEVPAAAADVGAASFQAQQERMKALHKNCAEGDVLGVRGILSGSLELLESIDPATGLTPMLQAIYANQVEVVKELMMAGAYPPPPTVTSEPAILAVLYPQLPPAQFGMPPAPVHFAPMSNGASSSEFAHYGQFGSGSDSAPVFPGNGQHRSSVSQERHNDANKLPPTEVSKTIPCRNFPNCRYGDACVFQHPQPQHFYPSAPYQPAEFVPGGFPGVPMYYGMAPPAPFVPLDAQTPAFAPPMRAPQPGQSVDVNGAAPAVPTAVSPAGPGSIPLNGATEINGTSAQSAAPSQQAPVFHPRPAGMNGFPVNQMSFPPQQAGFDQSKKGHHVKRMSFGGMPKAAWAVTGGGPAATLARQAALGSWSNGQPPACVFFQNSKCRNGEMCKFPHIMPDGTDCRHPDVIAGTVAAAPVSTNPNFRPPTRGRVSVGNNFHFERQQHFMKVQAMRQQQAVSRTSPPATGNTTSAEKTEAATETEVAPTDEDAAAKIEISAPAVPVAPKAQVTAQAAPRTRSVPNTRAHSPNANVPSTSKGPRVGGRPAHAGNGQAARSTSIPAATKEAKQKLPSADDFPALAGSTGSLNDSGVIVKPGPYGNKTAAQVLSAPAPPKPVSTETEEVKTDSRSRTSSVGQGLSTESDDEAVVISIKDIPEAPAAPSSSTAPAPASKGPISFASIASKTSTEAPMMVASQA